MSTIATTPEVAQSRPMGLPKIGIGRLAAHLSLLLLVILWTFPTVGLLVSSVRDKDQLALTGWWTALTPSTLMSASRPGTADKAVQAGDHWEMKGNLFGGPNGQTVQTFGATNQFDWKSLVQNIDAQGRVTSQMTTMDDNTARVDVFDVDGTQPWTSYTNLLDAQGHITQQIGIDDHGQQWVLNF